MRSLRTLSVWLGIGLLSLPALRAELPRATPNANTVSAGTLRDGVLTIALEARRTMWHPDGDSLPGREVPAFGEEGRDPLVPGPLIRIPAQTAVRLTVRNTDFADTLLFLIPPRLRGSDIASVGDTTVIPPGEKREVRFTAERPGNFHYRATARDSLSRFLQMYGLLGGAVIVDSAGSARPPRDRIFVMNWSIDSINPAGQVNLFTQAPAPIPSADFSRSLFAINGRSWPHNEKLSATVGDSLTWRIVNLSDDIHPMHLHGFYFRVDDFSGPAVDGQGTPGRMVVTERMPPFSAMSITWVPQRAGNWLFHCHFAVHVLPPSQLMNRGARIFTPPGSESAAASHASHANHARTGMAGLVMGINVRPRSGDRVSEPARGRRQLRLVAVQDSGFPENAPSLRFTLEGHGGQRRSVDAGPGFSPPIHLQRGEPVSVTIVNTMREATAVHWHGIELESYYDGVPGFGGFARRVSPIIAPRDSFEARFTPPRAGTFIYHSHVNEPRQHRAGLLGALIVHDSMPRNDDVIVLLKAPRGSLTGNPPLEINGQANPDTAMLHVGLPARIRLISLTFTAPNATVWLTARPDSSSPNLRDSMVVEWRPIAKDGADLPSSARTPRLARQMISMGETYDFEFLPPQRGHYRLEVRSAALTGRLLARVPPRVE